MSNNGIMNRLKKIFETSPHVEAFGPTEPVEPDEIFHSIRGILCPGCNGSFFEIISTEIYIEFECYNCGYTLEFEW